MHRVVFISLLIFGTRGPAFSSQQPEARIRRISPTDARGLPINLVRQLQRRSCTIPQEQYSKKISNVIKGEFARPGQKDWAVLCSVKGVSTILVFWNGSEKNPASIAPMEDRIYIQAFRKSESSYSRGIRPVGRDFITLQHNGYGGRALPPINHQGIADTFTDKAPTVWYYYQGQWLKLPGSY